ncbi:MAG: hypothetical protein ACJA1B_000167 [Polaribacter sp.]|jgi:hypothetical protein
MIYLSNYLILFVITLYILIVFHKTLLAYNMRYPLIALRSLVLIYHLLKRCNTPLLSIVIY